MWEGQEGQPSDFSATKAAPLTLFPGFIFTLKNREMLFLTLCYPVSGGDTTGTKLDSESGSCLILVLFWF